MTADLAPDVRDRAAETACNVYAYGEHPGDDPWPAVVDAVTAVVAEEIKRQLKAEGERIETDRNRRLTESIAHPREDALDMDGVVKHVRYLASVYRDVPGPQAARIADERDALQARVDVLSPMVEDLTGISREAQARVQLLTAALTEMLSQNLPGRVWDEKVRALLAAGETESEARDGLS